MGHGQMSMGWNNDSSLCYLGGQMGTLELFWTSCFGCDLYLRGMIPNNLEEERESGKNF